jgi:hypothetical protein
VEFLPPVDEAEGVRYFDGLENLLPLEFGHRGRQTYTGIPHMTPELA